jgi:hypothetical protein
VREFALQVTAHISQIEGFEVSILRLVKQHYDAHDFALTQLAVPEPLPFVTCQQVLMPNRTEFLPEIIDVNEQLQ